MSNHCSHNGCTQNRFTEISDTEEKCIFHCEKDDWYTENSEGVKIWKKELVGKFWEEIREKKMKKKDYYFCEFIFPKFEDSKNCYEKSEEKFTDNLSRNIFLLKITEDRNFWNKGKDILFSTNADFSQSIFLGNVYLNDIHFSKSVNFNKSIFESPTYFGNSLFFGNTNFKKSIFKNKLSFSPSHSNISKELGFRNTVFFQPVFFSDTKFLLDTDFDCVEFSHNAYFYNIESKESFKFSNICQKDESIFTGAKFHGRSHFIDNKCLKINFLGSNFLNRVFFQRSVFEVNFGGVQFSEEKGALFTKAKFQKGSKFEDVNFPEMVKFRNCDLSNVSFLDSNIETVQFENCHFSPRKKNEVIDTEVLFDERKVLKNKEATADDFEKVERLYRQLKKNFDDKKDYQKADDFYVGEMEMMRKKLEAEEKGSFWIAFILLFISMSILMSLLLYLFNNDSIAHFNKTSEDIGIALSLFSYFLIYILYFTIPSLAMSHYLSTKTTHASKLFILNIYKEVSSYNSNPIKAIIVLFLIIWNFSMLYWSISKNFSFFNSLGFSFNNSIPFLGDFLIKTAEGKIQPLQNYGIINFFIYPQKILSAGIILLFGLSLRRKFKR